MMEGGGAGRKGESFRREGSNELFVFTSLLLRREVVAGGRWLELVATELPILWQ